MKKAIIGLAVVAVVGVAVWALVSYPPKGAGKATGSVVKPSQAKGMQRALWEELAVYEDDYLDAYAEYFESKPDEPMELLFAFNELAYNVTGPGGLWRKTVPDKYFGCAHHDHLPICKKFNDMKNDFSRWDKLQDQINNLDDNKQAKRFLNKHGNELKGYIKKYVPTDESFTAVQATPFFSENLAQHM